MFKSSFAHAVFCAVQTLCSVTVVIKFAENSSSSKNHKIPLDFKNTKIPVYRNGKLFSHS